MSRSAGPGAVARRSAIKRRSTGWRSKHNRKIDCDHPSGSQIRIVVHFFVRPNAGDVAGGVRPATPVHDAGRFAERGQNRNPARLDANQSGRRVARDNSYAPLGGVNRLLHSEILVDSPGIKWSGSGLGDGLFLIGSIQPAVKGVDSENDAVLAASTSAAVA